MDLPTPNIPLLRKAVEWAEAEAAKTDGTGLWHQSVWATRTDCGTAFCIAGHVCATAHPTAQVVEEPCACGAQCSATEVSLRIDGAEGDWHIEARDLLGITDGQACLLFDPSNDIEDVRIIAEQIAARAGERL